jgi:hypothetical protein
MRKLITILCCLLLSSCATFLNTTPKEQTDFEYVCAAVEVDCKELGIVAPIAVISAVVGSGYYGFYYPGEPYVFITKFPGNETTQTIIVHETTHYVLYEAGIRKGRCHSERVARRVTAEFKGLEYDPTWETQYGCQNGEADKRTGPYLNPR